MKTTLVIIGILMLLTGAVWIGQGSGYFPYPASSFMIGDKTWTYIGIVVAIAGLGLIYFARRN